MSPRRKALYLISALALAVVTVLPGTGWLVRRQLRTATMVPEPVISNLNGERSDPRWRIAQDRVLSREPKDFALQLADALRGRSEEAPSRLRELQNRFPDQPAALALRLRYLAKTSIRIGRSEEQMLLYPPRRTATGEVQAQQAERKISTTILADFVQTARQGEKLAPTNAYFPAMLATGFFAVRRDQEALEALQRAADCSQWEEYISTELEGKWRLAQAANGAEIGTFPRFGISVSVESSHYATLRAMARIAVVHAVKAEIAGRAEEGLAIRSTLARLGATMRAQSSSLVGSFVGRAITQQAAARPGGAPSLPRGTDEEAQARQQQTVTTAYCAYLNRIGHAEKATWYRNEVAAGEQIEAVHKVFADTILGVPAADRLISLWSGAQILLSNILTLVVLGLVAAFVRRITPGRAAGVALPPHTVWGMALGLLTPILVYEFYPVGAVSEILPAGSALAYLAFVIGVPALFRFTGKQVFGGAMSALITLASVAAIAAYGAVQGRVDIWSINYMVGCFSAENTSFWGGGQYLIHGMLSLAASGVLILGLIVVRQVLRIPTSHALARGFEALAGPMAAILVLGYAGWAGFTAYQEKQAQNALAQMAHHEGRYLARQAGIAWPSAETTAYELKPDLAGLRLDTR